MASSRTQELRITGEVRPLLVQLEAIGLLLAEHVKKNDAPSASAIEELIGSIRGEIHSVADIFSRLETWEMGMKCKIQDIAKEIDRALEDAKAPEDGAISANDLHSRLLTAKESAAGFKGNLAAEFPLRLESLESYVEPQPYFSSPPPTPTENAECCELGFDASKSVADFEEAIKSCYSMESAHLLLFLGMFPTGCSIKKMMIHRWWIPHDLAGDYRERTDMILRDFERNGLIKCACKGYKSWDIESCTVNPRASQALTNLAGSESMFRFYAHQTFDPLTLRSCLLPEQNQAAGRWGTCINIDRRCLRFKRDKFEEMAQDCYALMLGRWHESARKYHVEVENTDFLNWLGSFQHLGCLSLRGISRITELPPSIGDLRCLRMLDLRACYDLQSLPAELTRLASLKYMDVTECYFLPHMPQGMESLTGLNVLKGFVVGHPQTHGSCQLGEISALSNLKKLSISVGRDSILEDEQFGKLSRLTSLISLTITWSISAHTSSSSSSSSRAPTVNEADVSPPPNLEKLDIRCVPQGTKTQWLSAGKLSKLKSLYIRGGHLNLQTLCVSGPTWTSVRVMRLRFLHGVIPETAELRKAFPNVEFLETHECSDSKSKHP